MRHIPANANPKNYWNILLIRPHKVFLNLLRDASLFGFFAIVAVSLACIGVYGVISYSVRQRTQEIGLRMALGAHTGDVLLMILKQGAVLVLVGISLGLAGALALTRFIKSFLFGITATDAGTLVIATALLMAAAMLACLLPARHAMKVDPLVALRYE